MSAAPAEIPVPDFDLRALVIAVAESSDVAEPKALTDEVLRRIPARHRLAALETALPAYVSQAISNGQRNFRQLGSVPGRSWKTEGARAFAQRFLHARIDVSSAGTGEWKLIGDCAVEDCLGAAALRRAMAAANVAQAERLEKLGALLDEYGAETVADLPEPVLVAFVTGGAVDL